MPRHAAMMKFIRQQHPQDRQLAPFRTRPARPYTHPRRPRTFHELRKRLGDHGPMAERAAELAAIVRWIHDDAPEMSEPADVAMLSAKLAMDDLYVSAGLPLPTGKARLHLLPRLSPESRGEAARVLGQTSAEWEAAGRPHLDGERIAKTYTYTKSCIKKKERNDRA